MEFDQLFQMNILNAVTDNLETIVYVTDIAGERILYANRAMAEAVGIDQEYLAGKACHEVLKTHEFNALQAEPLKQLLNKHNKVKKKSHTWEFYHSGLKRWYRMKDVIIDWPDGSQAHLQTADEITSYKMQRERLEYAASMDMMTDTYNREWGRRLIQSILDEAVEGQSETLVFIDLDDLKRTNDLFGHEAGDRMILQTVELIKKHIRKSDVVCRWGGDEFIMVIRANDEQTVQVIKNIQKYMMQYNDMKKNEFELSFSYGIVAIKPGEYQSAEEVVAEADRRMYNDKRGVS